MLAHDNHYFKEASETVISTLKGDLADANQQIFAQIRQLSEKDQQFFRVPTTHSVS